MEHGGHRDERDRWGERRWRIDEPVARRQASAHDVGHVNGRMSRIERRDPDMNGQRPIKIFRAPGEADPAHRVRDAEITDQMRVEGPVSGTAAGIPTNQPAGAASIQSPLATLRNAKIR
ncbi:MAG: hypothetical protein ABW298_16400 [Candidatus Binatia bacterium]